MPSMRSHGEGTLFRRTRDKRWVAEVTMADGRRRSRSAPSKGEAAQHLKDLLRQKDQAIEDPRRLRVGPFLRTWLTSLELAPATIRQHEMIVRVHLEPALGRRLLTQLSPADVDAYLAGKRLDPQTKRHHRSTLRLALNYAMREGYVVRNVAALSKAPRLDRRERQVLTADQVGRIIEEARDERLWPLWVLIATTGLRVSEALGLVWSEVDDDAIHVRRQLARIGGKWSRVELKTRKSRRDIPLTPQAVEALRIQRARQDAERIAAKVPRPIDTYVFTTETGQPIHSTSILPTWYRLLRRMGLPRVTTHDLRHSAATILFGAGVPIEVIADLLGHSTSRVTADLYRHRVDSLQRDAARRMAEAVGR
jgi:integrase